MGTVFDITILGARGNIKPYAPGYQLHAGILIDNKLLFDFGEPQYLQYKPQAIFITHLHNDHACFVDHTVTTDIPIYLPQPHPIGQVLNSAIHLGEYTITPIPVAHSNRLTAVAYLIQKPGRAILYTGDMATMSQSNLQTLPKLDAVISEASFGRKGGLVRYDNNLPYGHAGIPDLIAMFKPYTNYIIFTHFGSWFVRDPAAGAAYIAKITPKGMTFEIAHDGSKFVV